MISVKFFGMHGLRMLVAGASSRRLQLVSEACVVGHGCLLGGGRLVEALPIGTHALCGLGLTPSCCRIAALIS